VAVISTPVHPTGERHPLSDVLGTQLTAGVRA